MIRTREIIEAELETIRKQSRREPDMRPYYDVLRENLRRELRELTGVKEKDSSIPALVAGLFLVLAGISGLAVWL